MIEVRRVWLYSGRFWAIRLCCSMQFVKMLLPTGLYIPFSPKVQTKHPKLSLPAQRHNSRHNNTDDNKYQVIREADITAYWKDNT